MITNKCKRHDVSKQLFLNPKLEIHYLAFLQLRFFLNYVIFLLSNKEFIFSSVKTILVYSLAVFYFLISVRLTANVHYCGGKIKNISIVGFTEHKSCCAGKPMKKGCCEDVQLCFKKSSVDQPSSPAVVFISSAIVTESYPAFVFKSDHQLYVPKHIKLSVNAPPPEVKVPIHLKNCVFII